MNFNFNAVAVDNTANSSVASATKMATADNQNAVTVDNSQTEESSIRNVNGDSIGFDYSMADEKHYMGRLMTKLRNIGSAIQHDIEKGISKPKEICFIATELGRYSAEDCEKMFGELFYAARMWRLGLNRGTKPRREAWYREFVQVFITPTIYFLLDCKLLENGLGFEIKHSYNVVEDSKVYKNFQGFLKMTNQYDLID